MEEDITFDLSHFVGKNNNLCDKCQTMSEMGSIDFKCKNTGCPNKRENLVEEDSDSTPLLEENSDRKYHFWRFFQFFNVKMGFFGIEFFF